MNGNTYRVAQNHENPQFLWKRRNVMFPKSIFHGDTVAHVDHLHLLINQKIHLTISKVDTWIRGFPILLTLSTSSVLMLAYRQLRGGDRGTGGRIVFQGGTGSGMNICRAFVVVLRSFSIHHFSSFGD